MRKVSVFLIIAAFGIMLCSVSFAETENGPISKLGRGVANIITSPLGIFQGIGDVSDEKGAAAGMTWGVVQGLVNFGKRLTVGAYETVTFPVPIPANYEPILDDPEFFLQKD